MTQTAIPFIDLDEFEGERSNAVVPGVLLAAGTSSRYGSANKLLAPVDGEPLVRLSARTLVQSDTDGVIVILGYEADHTQDALSDLDVSLTVNRSYDRGLSTSVQKGVHAAQNRGADAVLIALGDMPVVFVDSINSLLEAYERGAGSVIAPAYKGQRGNPVLFDSQYFEPLTDVSGDIGGREILLSSDDAVLIETDDRGILRDIDRPDDL